MLAYLGLASASASIVSSSISASELANSTSPSLAKLAMFLKPTSMELFNVLMFLLLACRKNSVFIFCSVADIRFVNTSLALI